MKEPPEHSPTWAHHVGWKAPSSALARRVKRARRSAGASRANGRDLVSTNTPGRPLVAMSRRNFAGLSLFMIGSVALLACTEDDDADPRSAASDGRIFDGRQGGGEPGRGWWGSGRPVAEARSGATPCAERRLSSRVPGTKLHHRRFAGRRGVGPRARPGLDTTARCSRSGLSYIGKTRSTFARRTAAPGRRTRADMDLPQPEISAIAWPTMARGLSRTR